MNFAQDVPLLFDFEARDEQAAITAVAELLRLHPGVVDFHALVAAVWERQCIQPPLMGNGIALPHARTAAVRRMVFAMGRCQKPIPFGKEGDLVRFIFLYAAPPEHVAESLARVANLARLLSRPETLADLTQAETEAEFRNALA